VAIEERNIIEGDEESFYDVVIQSEEEIFECRKMAGMLVTESLEEFLSRIQK